MTYQLIHTTTNAQTHILCMDNDFHHEMHVDRKIGMSRRTWKTEAGAVRFASQRWNSDGRFYCKPQKVEG